MIVRKRPNAFLLFFVLRGSVILRIWPQLIGVFVISGTVVTAHWLLPGWVPGVNSSPFALVGIALSVFLGFRNSACYERWWEGRILWGEIMHTARDMARQTLPLADPDRRAILTPVIRFAHDLAAQLRSAPGPMAHDRLTEIAGQIARVDRSGALTMAEAIALQDSLLRLSRALIGCERLANTPLPFTYTLLLHRTAYMFCFLLPFGFADMLGWLTPIAVGLVAYAFFGLDALAEELENPFGLLPNDLPIAAYATTVEITLRQALGETDLPAPPQPVDGVLI